MTIYTSAKDEAGKSSCTGECSKMWPALAASSTDKSVGPFTVINGSQWAFNGKPLYTYAQDKKSGEMNGASIPGWSVASVSPSAPAEKPAH
jgi:predicted lipoprotein with Yx(FWY)xxD motif